MGIPGLLPALKDFTKTNASIRDWQGKAIAVDTSCWLHKAVYSVANDYVEETEAGKVMHKTVQVASRFLVQRCTELITGAGVSKLYLVLDGQHRCPLKAVTHKERNRKRQEALQEARQAPTQKAAYEKYKACIRITHPFTQAVLQQVKKDKMFRQSRKIVLVQAPHEADAQLVHLEKAGHVQAILTEDSDVLVYAVAARSSVTVLYKFNRYNGLCQAIRMDWLWDKNSDADSTALGSAATANNSSKAKVTQQQVWRALQSRERVTEGAGRRLFVQACVLTGCDYAPNELPGIGLVKAFQLLIMGHSAYLQADNRFSSVVRGRLIPRSATTAYVDKLRQAEAVFYYHPVRRLTGHLSWLTGSLRQPCSPSFPAEDLAILGDPAQLQHLSFPVEKPTPTGSNEGTAEVVSQDAEESSDVWNPSQLESANDKNPSATLAFDDAMLESLAQPQKAPAVIPVIPKAASNNRPPLFNPYRKRPLAQSSSPNQRQKKRSVGGFIHFARFRHAPEKENKETDPQLSQPIVAVDVSNGPDPMPLAQTKKDDPLETCVRTANKQQNYETDQQISRPIIDFDLPVASLTKKDDPLEDGSATDDTDNSSVASPSNEVTTSPYFATSKKFVRKVSHESYTKPAPVAGNSQTGDSKFSSPQNAKAANPVAPTGTDFYDDWLSPEKGGAELEDDVIETDDSPPAPASRPVILPIGPQGALRFRLGGLLKTNSKRTATGKADAPAKDALSTKDTSMNQGRLQRKLVYRPPRSTGTLFDHFRAKKP